MPDLTGPIQAFERAHWLWLIPVFPLLGALACALRGSGFLAALVAALRDQAKAGGSPVEEPSLESRQVAVRLAVAGAALSAAASVVFLVELTLLPAASRFLFDPMWQGVRVGQLEASVHLALDPLSSVGTVLVSVLGTIACLDLARSAKWADFRLLAWANAFLGCALLVLLADNLVVLLACWEGLGLAAWGLLRTSVSGAARDKPGGRWLAVQYAGNAALVLAATVLFWSLGGGWMPSTGYQSDLNPRVAAVGVTETDSRPSPNESLSQPWNGQGKARLTVSALPGSLVYADESHTPLLDASGLPLRTPFSEHELASGTHAFRVAPDDTFREVETKGKRAFILDGGVLSNYTVGHLVMGGDREVALALMGPTLTFRELRDELIVMDQAGRHPVRDMLLGRKVAFGLPAIPLVCLLLLLGVCARSAQVPLHGWLHEATRAPAGAFVLLSTAGMLTAGVYVIARLGFLFALSPVASGAVAVVGAATAAWGAMGSALQYDLRRVISYGTMSQLGVALVAFGTHTLWAGVLEVVVSSVVVACLASCAGTLGRAMRPAEPDASAAHDLRKLGGLARRLPRTARTFQVACLAFTMAPVPLLAGFWPTTLILQETFTTDQLPGVLAKVIGAVLLTSIGLVGFAMWRAYYLIFLGAPQPGRAAGSKGKDAPEERHGLSWLGVACVVTGAALGMSSRLVGGPGGAALESWLGPVFSTATSQPPAVSGAVALGLAALVLLAACCGWAIARGRYGSGRSGVWADEEAKSPFFGWGARFR